MQTRFSITTLAFAGAAMLAACSPRATSPAMDTRSPDDVTGTSSATVADKPFPAFVEFDLDGDQEVTKAEFESALQETPMLMDWDVDGDGELTDVEFQTHFYRAWDINGDDVVDITEYKNNSGYFFHDAGAFGSFEDYDLDGDQELTMEEFSQPASLVRNDWDDDGDGELTDLELRTALYDAWDLDGDGDIDHYEYRWK